MTFKKYGKNINTDKLQKSKPLNGNPSNQISSMPLPLSNKIKDIDNSIIDPKRYSTFTSTSYPTDGTALSPNQRTPRDYPKDLANPLYNYFFKNSITRLSLTLKSVTTGTTSINIVAGVEDFSIRKGDEFYIYNNKNFKSIKLTADADLFHSDTTITITATNFKRSDYYPAGSFILPNNKKSIQSISNGIEYKKYTLTNAQYKTLYSSPYTLLAAEAGSIHLPISCYIQYIHGGDEMVRSNLYIGHNVSTLIGKYWASILNFAYRNRDSMLFQMGASTYGAGLGSDNAKIPLKINNSDGTNIALKLHSSLNFTSTGSYIKVHLYYKTITA